jgi:hypothetical protein
MPGDSVLTHSFASCFDDGRGFFGPVTLGKEVHRVAGQAGTAIVGDTGSAGTSKARVLDKIDSASPIMAP